MVAVIIIVSAVFVTIMIISIIPFAFPVRGGVVIMWGSGIGASVIAAGLLSFSVACSGDFRRVILMGCRSSGDFSWGEAARLCGGDRDRWCAYLMCLAKLYGLLPL